MTADPAAYRTLTAAVSAVLAVNVVSLAAVSECNLYLYDHCLLRYQHMQVVMAYAIMAWREPSPCDKTAKQE